jgi:group I intron endonuclease
MSAVIERFATTGESLKKLSGVYAIIHRDTGMVYVGSSADIQLRISAHLRAARIGKNSPLYRAMRASGASAFDLEVLERCEKELNKSRENFYIALMGAASANGFNVLKTAHAYHGRVVSESTRERLRVAATGRKQSPEAIERTASANRGRKCSAETRAKIGAANRGKKRTSEQIAQRTASRAGWRPSAEHIEKLASAHRGKIVSPETRAKMRAAQIGKKQSAEHIEKAAAKRRGQKRTPEVRAKMSAAKRLAYCVRKESEAK